MQERARPIAWGESCTQQQLVICVGKPGWPLRSLQNETARSGARIRYTAEERTRLRRGYDTFANQGLNGPTAAVNRVPRNASNPCLHPSSNAARLGCWPQLDVQHRGHHPPHHPGAKRLPQLKQLPRPLLRHQPQTTEGSPAAVAAAAVCTSSCRCRCCCLLPEQVRVPSSS